MRFEYRLLHKKRTAATGSTDLACLDAAGKPTRIPSEITEKLKEWL